MEVDSNPADQRTSRKHLRSSSDDIDYDWSSDESGRFDDADEPEMEDLKSPSAKSKRRRSNDWPLPEEAADYGHDTRRNGRNGNGSLGSSIGAHFKASPRASPRTSAASLRGRHSAAASNSPRNRLGRRSRFVEATMSDSVSEKPPSIFMHESKRNSSNNRSSGIFRFGKAIASAFNPFGGWNKSSPEHEQNNKAQPPSDALTQAELAYAELKKAGYKGTNKGSYLQSQNVDQTNADQTFNAILEKMGYGGPIESSVSPSIGTNENTAPTPSRSTSKASKRSSFQDIRKATSLGLPFIKSQETTTTVPSACAERSSEESFDNHGLRKQKSRREISRQAKLLKKVSNLEDKLDRARRELRQLSGNEERLPAPTPERKSMSVDMDPGSYPRKFVPGALPTLPSERLLDQQATISESPEPELGPLTALPSVEGRASLSIEDQGPLSSPSAAKSPKRRSRDSRPSSMGKESFSRKRKSSPVPEPVASRILPQSSPTHRTDLDDALSSEYKHLIDSGLLSPPRQAKWPKFDMGDSPGSVERKRHLDHPVTQEASLNNKRSPSIQPRKSPAGLNRSPTTKAVGSPPPLRNQPGRSNLRSVSPSANTGTSAFLSSDNAGLDNWLSPSPPPAKSEVHRSFYLQPHLHLDPDRTPHSSPSKGSPRKRRWQDSDIPPVPPLPKELLPNAAKVTQLPAKKQSPGKNLATALSPPSPSVQNQQLANLEYPWPDDIF
ncbi:hypothetical protein N7532_011681 [Penicillium argentinense]|uniref:Nuclear RNA binding protein n=1 Tax=Penicillium argentinense TaxID=1131581 RepID=A0A9W9EIV0_9EURO|nr:uncharacterized protein N7532_011681 [Penicillium argentinense]KAJ5082638.1 hypothetical protein N7532_011681 [Penicillium argentinense]